MTATVAEPQGRPTGVLVASTLCWLWGILCSMSGIALLIPALASAAAGPPALLAALVVLGVGALSCVAGHLIRKGRVTGARIGVFMAAAVAALQLFAMVNGRGVSIGALAGMSMNAAIIVLLTVNWRYFRKRDS